MAKRRADIAAAELDVLKALWDRGPSTVRETRDHLEKAGRDLAHTTVLTFLTRLEQKGFVRSDRSGVAYVYTPAVSREQVVGSRVEDVMKQLFDGAAGPLVLHLVRNERLSPDEIDELRRLIDHLDEADAADAPPTRKKTRGKRGRGRKA